MAIIARRGVGRRLGRAREWVVFDHIGARNPIFSHGNDACERTGPFEGSRMGMVHAEEGDVGERCRFLGAR